MRPQYFEEYKYTSKPILCTHNIYIVIQTNQLVVAGDDDDTVSDHWLLVCKPTWDYRGLNCTATSSSNVETTTIHKGEFVGLLLFTVAHPAHVLRLVHIDHIENTTNLLDLAVECMFVHLFEVERKSKIYI